MSPKTWGKINHTTQPRNESSIPEVGQDQVAKEEHGERVYGMSTVKWAFCSAFGHPVRRTYSSQFTKEETGSERC